MISNKFQGDRGEALVAAYLEQQGFKILARKYRRAQGEIDIIASNSSIVAFVEVKARTHSFVDLTEVITPAKQRRMLLTARWFITEHDLQDVIYRFDIACIENLTQGTVTYYANAFTEGDL